MLNALIQSIQFHTSLHLDNGNLGPPLRFLYWFGLCTGISTDAEFCNYMQALVSIIEIFLYAE